MTDDEIRKRIITLQSKADTVHEELMNSYQRRIVSAYKKSLEEIKKKIALMYEKYGDSVTYQDMQSYNRLAVLEKEIAIQLKELTGESIKITTESIKESFSESYYRNAYGFENGLGVKMGFGQLNPTIISAAVLNPLDSVKWPNRIKDHVANKYNNAIRQEITQGLIEGKGYAKIAQGITKQAEVTASRALVIARTESGRAQSIARVLTYDKAEAAAERLGIKTTRIWASTLDQRTRDTHRSMDGQEANEKKKFLLPSGVETDGPRLSGIPDEDINCRCTSRMEIKGIPHKVRRDNIDKSLIKNMTFDEWAAEKGIRLRKTIKNDDIGLNKYKRFNDTEFGSVVNLNLSEDEAGAIKYYTSDDRKINALNAKLREGTASKNDKTIEKVLNQALNKMPNYKGFVYRGIKISDVDSFIKPYISGKDIDFSQFISTSFKKTESYYGNIQYKILSKTGKDVSSLSFKPKEKEVLFMSDAKFMMKRIENKNGITYITLKEK